MNAPDPTRANRGKWGAGGQAGPLGSVAPLRLGPGVWDLDIITVGTSNVDTDLVDLTMGGNPILPLIVGTLDLHHHYVFVSSAACCIEATLNAANTGLIWVIIAATRRDNVNC